MENIVNMATTNPITGDTIASKWVSNAYSENYEAVFGAEKFGTVSDPEGNVIDKCCKRCWLESNEPKVFKCNKPGCDTVQITIA